MVEVLSIDVPKSLVEKVRERGLDLETLIVELIAKELDIDPEEEAKAHLELAEKLFREGIEFIAKGDVVQASEKLYKAAEESIKALALHLGIEEAKQARSRGRWTLKLLDRAAKELSERVSNRVYDDWAHAYFLHVEGFHEACLDIEQAKNRVRYVEELLRIARDTCVKGQ